jgi:NADH:ubiquinone oxidoreductase subunit K
MFPIILFILGIYCLATKRNMIKLVIGLEILINSANLSFIIFSAQRSQGIVELLPQAVVFFSISIAGGVTAVVLSLVLNAYRQYKTLDISNLRKLKG